MFGPFDVPKEQDGLSGRFYMNINFIWTDIMSKSVNGFSLGVMANGLERVKSRFRLVAFISIISIGQIRSNGDFVPIFLCFI